MKRHQSMQSRRRPARMLIAMFAMMVAPVFLSACVFFYDAEVDNPCGGSDAIIVDGRVVSPGEVCGICDDGTWVCDGTDGARCEGATNLCLVATNSCGDGVVQNSCGGCVELAGEWGRAVGTAVSSGVCPPMNSHV